MTPLHSHSLHSHSLSPGDTSDLLSIGEGEPLNSHSMHSAKPSVPYVPFAIEPPSISAQIEKLGGKATRHNFADRAYNPGIVPNHYALPHLKSDYIMTYRAQEVSRHISVSTLYLVGVNRNADDSFTTVWKCPLELPDIEGHGTPMHEDGRLLWFNGYLFLAYSNVRLWDEGVKFKQSLVSLEPSRQAEGEHKFKVAFHAGPLYPLGFANNLPEDPAPEKNWQFFESDNRMHFVHSIYPHVVMAPMSSKVYQTESIAAAYWQKVWGEIHGGTPPIKLPDGRFLSFFNSYVAHPEHQRRYVVGAYIFSANRKDKFKIEKLTAGPILFGSERDGFLWESPAHWEPIVVFATGALLEGNDIILSYGVNDCFCETARIPLDRIMEFMLDA